MESFTEEDTKHNTKTELCHTYDKANSIILIINYSKTKLISLNNIITGIKFSNEQIMQVVTDF